MSLLKQVKERIKKKEEQEKKKVLCKKDKTLQLFDKEFLYYEKMEEIRGGNFGLLPIECLLTHYVLKYEFQGYYCGLEDKETGDLFEVYEFDVGEENPDCRAYNLQMSGKEHLYFLVEKIKQGFEIYIEERKSTI